MDIPPIRADAGHKAAPREVPAHFDNEPKPGSPDGDRVDVPVTLIEAIKFRMEQGGRTPKDLLPAIGRLNRVYEILARQRPLTLAMIWRPHGKSGIPAESLFRPTRQPAAA